MPPATELPPIVVGLDGSAPSILALRWAGALAPMLNARIRAASSWQFRIAFGIFTPVVWNPDEEARRICAEYPFLVAHGTGLAAWISVAPVQASVDGGGQAGSNHARL